MGCKPVKTIICLRRRFNGLTGVTYSWGGYALFFITSVEFPVCVQYSRADAVDANLVLVDWSVNDAQDCMHWLVEWKARVWPVGS